MSFFSFRFICFFILIFVLYNALPCRLKQYCLLVASIVFYACFDLKYTLVLILVTTISFLAAKCIQKWKANDDAEGDKKSRFILSGGIVFLIMILLYFKFWNYFALAVSRLFGTPGVSTNSGAAAIIAPVGISFFTLEAIGYIVDVYKGKVEAEKDFFKYALFIVFFPKVMSGPIERSTNLLKQIHYGVVFNYERVRHGFLLVLWGSFIKLLIANRLAVIVDAAFDNYHDQTGFTMMVAVIIYGIQLYLDFAGYSYMAIGLAATFGYTLTDNFTQPYFARNIRDFWKRWHISLSSWLRDYVYIPLGGSRKGNFRRYVNLLLTFIVSGFWHGTGIHYVIWGLIHGVYQVSSLIIQKRSRCIEKDISSNVKVGKNVNTGAEGSERFSTRLLQAFITYVLVDFAWLFFRADSVGAAIEILNKIVMHPEVGRSIYEGLLLGGVEIKKSGILVAEVLLLLTVDLYHEKYGQVLKWLDMQSKWFRWSVYVIMAMFIIIGIIRDYGVSASTFIYASF